MCRRRDQGHEAFVADYTQAFLDVDVRDGGQVYAQPDGWTQKLLLDGRRVVWKLRKAMLGLRTSPRRCQEHLSNKLKEHGYRQDERDPCLYMNENLDVCTGVHVDGFLTDSRSEVSIARRIYSESNRLDQEKHRCNLVPGAMLLPWIYARCRIGVHRGESCSISLPRITASKSGAGGYYYIVAIEVADWMCLQLLRSWKCLSAPDVLRNMASGLCRCLTTRDQRLRC